MTAEVFVQKKPKKALWYVMINGRITGAASTRPAAKDMAAKLAVRIAEQPDVDVPKARMVKTKTGAVSKAAQKRMAQKES